MKRRRAARAAGAGAAAGAGGAVAAGAGDAGAGAVWRAYAALAAQPLVTMPRQPLRLPAVRRFCSVDSGCLLLDSRCLHAYRWLHQMLTAEIPTMWG